MSDRAKPETFMLQDFIIDLDQHRVSVAGCIGALAATDYELLCVLSLNPGLVTTTQFLQRRLWGCGSPEVAPENRTGV